jgi:hypothetical protein
MLLFPNNSYVLYFLIVYFFDQKRLGYILGDFYTNSSGLPDRKHPLNEQLSQQQGCTVAIAGFLPPWST